MTLLGNNNSNVDMYMYECMLHACLTYKYYVSHTYNIRKYKTHSYVS